MHWTGNNNLKYRRAFSSTFVGSQLRRPKERSSSAPGLRGHFSSPVPSSAFIDVLLVLQQLWGAGGKCRAAP